MAYRLWWRAEDFDARLSMNATKWRQWWFGSVTVVGKQSQWKWLSVLLPSVVLTLLRGTDGC